MGEENKLSKRLRRYGQVGGRAAGFTLQATGSVIRGRGLVNDQLAQQLVATLGELRGPLVKVAQILATIPDAVPPAFQEAMSQLQAHAPSMGKRFVERRMRAELGEHWRDRFQNFSPVASFAASLGQVHEATTSDGEHVAVKLQYPDMDSAVEADLAQLDVVLGIMRRVDGVIDTSAIREELAARLREELDYIREAKLMAAYAKMLAHLDIKVPQPLTELSTSRLLTMTWCEGEKIFSDEQMAKQSAEQIDHLAGQLFSAWWHPLVGYAVIHGDPHPGNYTINKDGQLNLLDFGCVRVFEPEFIDAVITLYEGFRENRSEQRAEAYKAWGFDNISKDLMDVLDIWAGFIYGPLLDDRTRMIAEDIAPGAYGRAEAMAVHKALKALGPVRPPQEFVFMDRAAIGLGSVFIRLGAKQNWHQLFESQLAGATSLSRRKSQENMLQSVNLY